MQKVTLQSAPYGFIMSINFLNRGLLSLAFLFAFVKTVDLTEGIRAQFKNGYFLLGIWAVGAVLLAFFPTDVPATPMSWHGAIHFVVAIIAFIAGAFGTLVFFKTVRRKHCVERRKKTCNGARRARHLLLGSRILHAVRCTTHCHAIRRPV